MKPIFENNLKLEDLIDIHDQHSTGAKVGNNRPITNNLGSKMSNLLLLHIPTKMVSKPTISALQTLSCWSTERDLLNEERSDPFD